MRKHLPPPETYETIDYEAFISVETHEKVTLPPFDLDAWLGITSLPEEPASSESTSSTSGVSELVPDESRKPVQAPSETNESETNSSITTLPSPETSQLQTQPVTTMLPETEAPPSPTYPIITDNLYMDENIRITLTTIRRYDSNIHVADIHLTSPTYLKTSIATETVGDIRATVADQANAVGAILAINGDYYSANNRGYVMRNGVPYRTSVRESRFEDLAIHYDGSFFPFYETDYTLEELRKKGYYHILAFGPTLVKNGRIAVNEDEEVGVADPINGNPRTAIGIVDSLHYVIVVADGRTEESFGPSLYQLADVMRELGCKTAYNLDGGGSATMYFNGKIVNYPTTNGTYDERRVSDILYIGY